MGINESPVYVYYDREKGWLGTNPGWYEVSIFVHDPRETVVQFTDMVNWIEENIHGYKKHARWFYAGNYLKFKFRHEKDYIWFKLVWG